MLARKDQPRSPAVAPTVPAIDRIQQILASAGAPGTFATRHTAGIDDITLVLTKTRALFTRDAAECAAWARELAWLRENAKTFTTHGRAKARRTARR